MKKDKACEGQISSHAQGIRLKTIDGALQARQGIKLQDLLVRVNHALKKHQLIPIKLRQLQYDLSYIQDEWQNPINTRFQDRIAFKFYTDPDFSIFKQAIPEKQLSQLRNLLELLQHFEGTPELLELGPSFILHGKNIQDKDPLIFWDQNTQLQGLEHLSPLYIAIRKKCVIKIQYTPIGKPPQSYILHPRVLKQSNQRWYLISFEPSRNNEKFITPIDRINSITELPNRKYQYNLKPVNWKEYFDETIGISKFEEVLPEDIVIRAYGNCVNYIESKPLHTTQEKIQQEIEWADFKIRVRPNYELTALILRFGEEVEVLHPAWLREKIADRVALTLKLYQKNKSKTNLKSQRKNPN